MFVSKAGVYPSEAPFRCSALGWAPGLAHKQETSLERLAEDKRSSLLRKSVNYDSEIFLVQAPGAHLSGAP